MISQDFEIRIKEEVIKVAAYYAQALPGMAPEETPDTPDWLSPEAQTWIRQNYFEFSDLVLAARNDDAGGRAN